MKYQGFDLSGKSIIVTGAGTGIGQAMAVGLAQAGADLVLVGRRPDPLKEVEQEVLAQGVKALVLPGDISNLGFQSQAVSETIKVFGKIDVLINNAAVLFKGPIEDTSEEVWDTTIDINLKGNFFMALAVGKEMIKRKKGEDHQYPLQTAASWPSTASGPTASARGPASGHPLPGHGNGGPTASRSTESGRPSFVRL